MGNSSTKELAAIEARMKALEDRLPRVDPRDQENVLKQIEENRKEKVRLEKLSWRSSDSSQLDEIIGLEEVKNPLKAACLLPSKQSHLFSPKGKLPRISKILLYGPPGTGKTHLAKATAHDSKADFVQIDLALLGSKYIFELENRLLAVFEQAASNKNRTTVIFLDEIDSLGRRRNDDDKEWVRSQKNTLLQLIDNLAANLIFIGCTNFVDQLDEALLRRFDLQLYVRIPDFDARMTLFKKFIGEPGLPEEDLIRATEKTELYSGADIRKVIQKAKQASLENWMRGTSFKRSLVDGKYYPADKGEFGAEEISLINLPPNSAGHPPQLKVTDIFCALALVPCTSTIESLLRGAPPYCHDYIKKQVKMSLESNETPGPASQTDKTKVLYDLTMKFFEQPPETMQMLINYAQNTVPQSITENVMKYFFDH